MATTTNYGWTTPDNSGLVKNGAQDIRSLGTSIDTFLFRPFNKNAVINGGFDIWQRGTSFSIPASSSAAYYPDRFQIATGANQAVTLSRQVTGDTTNLPNIQYCSRIARNSGQTGTGNLNFATTFESTNSIPFAGKSVVLSFYARAGANYSAASSALGVNLVSGTGTDQNIYSGFTGSANVINSSATLTTTWQRFTFTATVGATATQLAFYPTFTPVGTAGAADYYEITGVQLEVGSTATPFSRNASSIQGELAACQRYYYRQIADSVYQMYGIGQCETSIGAYILFKPPVTMRIEPTSLDYATPTILYDGVNLVSVTNLLINSVWSGKDTIGFSASTAGSLVVNRSYSLLSNNSSSSYIGVSAEL